MSKGKSRSKIDKVLKDAIQRHRGGDLAHAEATYEYVLKKDPNNHEALHFMGVLKHQRGDSDGALELIDKALELSPDYVDARNNRGNIHKHNARLEAAEADYRRVVEQAPKHADAWSNLGLILRARKESEKAIECFQEAIKIDPQHAGAMMNLGYTLWHVGQHEIAMEAFRYAMKVSPDLPHAYLAIGSILNANDRHDEAREVFESWVRNEPDSPMAKHMLAASTDAQHPDRASSEYVVELFDKFANSFDRVLAELDYRAPPLVAKVFKDRQEGPLPLDRVCDAGCGTGLCGELLRDEVRQLIGVDLSEGMLRKALQRECFDELVQEDLVTFFREAEKPFDGIVSADTFCYFGNLAELLESAASATRDDGLLVFTVELLEEADADQGHPGFVLNRHGRYSHTESYVRDVLDEQGWDLLSAEADVLRKEGDASVTGLVVCARRRRSTAH